MEGNHNYGYYINPISLGDKIDGLLEGELQGLIGEFNADLD